MIKVSIDNKKFAAVLKQCAAVAQKSDSILSGVCIKFTPEFIELAATDGNVLAIRRFGFASDAPDTIAPKDEQKAVICRPEEVQKVLTFDKDANVLAIEYDEETGALYFQPFGRAKYEVETHEGQYPGYEAVTPGYSPFGFEAPQVGEPILEIGINRKYLETIMHNMTKSRSECVKLQFRRALDPIGIINTESAIMEYNLIMPIQLKK